MCRHLGEIPVLLPDAGSILEEKVTHWFPGARVGMGLAAAVSHMVGVPALRACPWPTVDWDQLDIPHGSQGLTDTWRAVAVFPETHFQPPFGPTSQF